MCQPDKKMHSLSEAVVKKDCDSKAEQAKIVKDLVNRICDSFFIGKFFENFICVYKIKTLDISIKKFTIYFYNWNFTKQFYSFLDYTTDVWV